MADRLKVSRRTYGKWERNQVDPLGTMLEGIAEFVSTK